MGGWAETLLPENKNVHRTVSVHVGLEEKVVFPSIRPSVLPSVRSPGESPIKMRGVLVGNFEKDP